MKKLSDGQKKPSKTIIAIGAVLLAALIASAAYLLYQMIDIQIFSATQLIAGALILVLFAILMALGLVVNRTHTGWRIVCMILSAAITVCCCMGGYYIAKTSEVFDLIGDSSSDDDEEDHSAIMEEADLITSKMPVTVTTYALQTSNITKPSELTGKTVGVVTSLDEDGTNGAIAQLQNSGASFETVEYTDVYSLTDALYAETIDAMILPEQYHDDLLDAANDYNKYNALTTFSNVVDQYIYYEDIPEDMIVAADPVDDITQDPFVVLISGSDSYGTLSAKSRSDVNMLVAVNPVTYEVLLVSIPRDAYLTFSCKKDATACGYAAGQEDKLTHSGIYGVGTTESTIEDFLDIDINYIVRVNFSSLINVVDAIGGIDVEVEEGLEVDTFYANGTEGVHAGTNHLNGERALAFARERYAYVDGDNQRVKNQQIVMKAIMKQMLSPAMVVNYPAFLRALSTAFYTNMPSSQIRELIKLEISKFPSWNIQSYAMSGNSTYAYSPSSGMQLSVSLIPDSQKETAQSLIEDVLNGNVVTVPDTTTTDDSSTDTTDSSQSSSDDSSYYYYDNSDDYQIPVPDDSWTPGYDAPDYSYPDAQSSDQDTYTDDSSWQQDDQTTD